MKDLTFKNYPPSVLVFLICLIVALNFGFRILWESIFEQKTSSLIESIAIIVTSSSFVLTALTIINRYCKWRWFLRLLGLMNVSGNYIGTATSSYYADDDPTKGHIKLHCKLQIVQNLNALKIEGKFSGSEDFDEHSSISYSSWEEMRKKDNGDFEIRYFYSNKGNKLHSYNKRYGLDNHDGVAVLTYSPINNSLKGYYFNHERFSNGEMFLELQSQIL